jgi:hypothetical protein
MRKDEFNRFSVFWNSIHEMASFGKPLSKDAMAMVFMMLEEYEINDIQVAVKKHCQQNPQAPTPACIIKILSPCLHISADEAWPIAVASWDQDVAVVITSEIMTAADIAFDAGNGKDDNAARMAFRSAYERITKIAPPPKWYVSQGNDKSKTEDVVTRAVQKGYLPAGTENKYRLEAPTTTVQKLIEGYVARVDVRKENMEAIKAMLIPDKIKKEKEVRLTDEEYNNLPWYLREKGTPGNKNKKNIHSHV